MPTADVSFYSRTLGMHVPMSVVTPRGKGPYPVLYLLHGLGGDCTAFGRSLPLQDLIERQSIMAVCPTGGKGYYCNLPGTLGEDWENYLVRDVVRFIDGTFQTLAAEPSGRAIGGASMGGYGALMLALRHPDVFSAAFSMSGSLYFAATPHPRGEAFQDQLAKLVEPADYDLFRLAEQAVQRGPMPALRLDCGTEDFLIDCNRQFHARLDELGIAHQYAESPGVHDWDYWRRQFPSNLDFVAQKLRA